MISYKLLTKNKMDTSTLEGYENHPDAGVVNFESFDKNQLHYVS